MEVVYLKVSWVQHFSPAWFAAVMGTGGLASVLFSWGGTLPWSGLLGTWLASINAVFLVLFLVPWLTRWLMHPEDVRRDLDHPILGNFFVTLPVAVMIVANTVVLMGRAVLGGAVLYALVLTAWWAGVAGVGILSIYVGYNLLRADQIPPHFMNLSWLITPVAAVVMPLIGNPLVTMMQVRHSLWTGTVHLVNLSFYGMGIVLFLFIGSITFSRLMQHALPPAEAAPTFWITLGPVGVGTIGLMGLADVSKSLGMLASTVELYLLAVALWGFGLWALGLAVAITWHYARRGGVPFSLSWWAFIFPLAAYTLSAMRVADYFGSGVIKVYAAALTLLLVALWSVTTVLTVKGVWSGRLFAAAQSQGAATVSK